MNDELQKALAEFVKATMAGFGQGKDFVLAQAPELIQQLIRWNFWQSMVLGVVVGVVGVVGWIGVWRFAQRFTVALKKKSSYDDDPFPWAMGALACGICAFIASGLSIESFLEALKISLAPKVWLLEWAMAQVKS